ncbi:VanZ family protein [bacterium]|nr:VanZ family protein [candidate division CSSED10-310 bacterium]
MVPRTDLSDGRIPGRPADGRYHGLRKIFWWISTILYIVVIYATLGIMPKARTLLTTRFGDGLYAPLYVLIGAGLILAGWYTLRGVRRNGPASCAVFVVLAGTYLWLMLRLDIVVERVHFLEYGLLSLFFLRLLLFYVRSPIMYAWCVLLTFLAGLGDETIQWLLPNRVGEYRDILINGQAALLVHLIVAFAIKPSVVSLRTTSRQMRMFSFALSGALLATTMFVVAAHEFGHTIVIENLISFNSRIREDRLTHLSRLTPDLLAQSAARNPGEHAEYMKEAGDHYNMMQFYCERSEHFKALGERKVVVGYFESGRRGLGLEWPVDCPPAAAIIDIPTRPFRTNYLENLITKVDRKMVIALGFLASALSLAVGRAAARRAAEA